MIKIAPILKTEMLFLSKHRETTSFMHVFGFSFVAASHCFFRFLEPSQKPLEQKIPNEIDPMTFVRR